MTDNPKDHSLEAVMERGADAIQRAGGQFCELSGEAPKGTFDGMASCAAYGALQPGDQLPYGVVSKPIADMNGDELSALMQDLMAEMKRRSMEKVT